MRKGQLKRKTERHIERKMAIQSEWHKDTEYRYRDRQIETQKIDAELS